VGLSLGMCAHELVNSLNRCFGKGRSSATACPVTCPTAQSDMCWECKSRLAAAPNGRCARRETCRHARVLRHACAAAAASRNLNAISASLRLEEYHSLMMEKKQARL